MLRDYECEEPVLEVFSDADWAADRSKAISLRKLPLLWWLLGIHHQGLKRSFPCQTYAAASAVMDAILIRTILCWVLQVRILMYL